MTRKRCGARTSSLFGLPFGRRCNKDHFYKGNCRSCFKVFARPDTGGYFWSLLESWTFSTNEKLLNDLGIETEDPRQMSVFRFNSGSLRQTEKMEATQEPQAVASEVFEAESRAFQLEKEKSDELSRLPNSIQIIGKDERGRSVWKRDAEVDRLCAHSEYAKSFMARWRHDSSSKSGDENEAALILEAERFTPDIIDAILDGLKHYKISGTCARSEVLVHLLGCTDYLGMGAMSLLAGLALINNMELESCIEVYEIIETLNVGNIMSSWQKKVGELAQEFTVDLIARFNSKHLAHVLSSDDLNLPEEHVLELLLIWRDVSDNATDQAVRDLIQHVKTPFVHTESPFMIKAVKEGYVSADHLALNKSFQENCRRVRSLFLGSSPPYRLRKNAWNRKDVGQSYQAKLKNWHLEQQRRVPYAIYRTTQEYRGGGFGMARMLGTVNGRDGFEKITSVQKSPSCDRVVCSGCAAAIDPATISSASRIVFSAASESISNKPCPDSLEWIDSRRLQTMDIGAVKHRLATMLTYEEELRLHPIVQSTYGRLGEDESGMVSFTTELQAYVADACNVERHVAIELIRSSASLFPDIAQISHYVRHNRCFRGTLKVGDEAPDVDLVNSSGAATTLWSEIETTGNIDKPTLILAASYT